jgi:asparagine synthase (glutamine-hydrolysing)
MCGISLMISLKNKVILKEEIKALNEKIVHRGPGDEGFFLNKNFAFGHRRLSIIDKSASANQPFQYKKSTIIHNGEVYNYIELKQELRDIGYNFITNTDTEVIAAAYAQWGVKAFEKFNGMWAFAIYDELANEIIICRDNFGIKPVNYTITENYFLLGSEVKQFTAISEFEPILNKRIAIDFLAKGHLNHSTETFFENVQELAAGHFLRFNLNTNDFKVEQWYNLCESVPTIEDDFGIAKNKLKSLFEESIRLRMRSDVVVGSCLSGGIDSSAIVCSVKQNNLYHNSFTTITSCFENKEFDEQIYSDEVTKLTNFISEKTFPSANQFFGEKVIDKIVYHHDQPIPSGSHYSEYSVCKKAKESNIIVLLDGQAADELLFGYPEFHVYYFRELLIKFQYLSFFKAIKDKAKIDNTTISKEFKILFFNLLTVPIAQFLKKKLAKKDKEKRIINITEGGVNYLRRPKSLRELSLLEMTKTSLPYQLHSLDRNSMMFSIEARLPFLDKHFVEYSIGLPSEYKIRNGYKKFIFREAISSLPFNIKLRKDKMAYEAPDEIWIREHKEYVAEQLGYAVKEFPFINVKAISYFEKFIKKSVPYDPTFFRILSFYRFVKMFNLKITP